MHRHPLPSLIALVAAGLFAATANAQAAPKAANPHAGHDAECAKACANCMQQCESCVRHCANLVAEGKKEHMKTLGTCDDCAEFCTAAARIVSHRGPMMNPMCEACAKACDTCAAACEKYPKDEHMIQCAKACRECARSCREMLKHSAGENK